MHRAEKYGFRTRLRGLLVAVPAGVAGIFLFSTAGLAEGPTIEAAGGATGYSWSPSSAQTASGGSVTFKNPSGSVPHGVTWNGGPETPSCSGVPINGEKTDWSGSCVFAQAGTYSFYCPVHPTEMKGTITVSSSGTVPNPPPPTGTPDGPALKALTFARRQRGHFVRGSADISQAGAGGRLRVDLFATRAKLFGPGHPGKLRVGRLIRSSLPEGLVSFKVSLTRAALRALRLNARLPLQVKVTVTPLQGAAQRQARTVIVHA